MGDRPSHNLGGVHIDLARRIDAVCRQFEADWREVGQQRFEDYLAQIPEEGRAALRTELEALEHELRQADETMARPSFGPIAEAPTISPTSPPTSPIPGMTRASVHEDATVAPRDQVTVDHGSCALAPSDASEPSRVRYFGDYEIARELARGGMGVVFLARQVSLNRPVALKMILAGQLADETDVRRFYTEAEAAANLDHPGIVPIFEVGQHDGQHYFSMAFVEGQSLSQRLAEGPLPPCEASGLMVKVAEAIEYAHQRGVIHRDLKPSNILVDRNGNPRVTDFGLAKRLQSDSGLTGSGQIMGTPSYMPPEQAGGNHGEVGPPADVYALGATLYALLTGRPPFQAATPMDTVTQVTSDEPVPPRRLNASIPRDLETICLKCLQKEPAKRYARAAALEEDLRRFLDGSPIVARPVGPGERAAKWARRRPAIAALSAAVVLSVLGGLLGTSLALRSAIAGRDAALRAEAAEREQARIARLREQEARDQAELANRRLYDARMNQVQGYWEGLNAPLVGRVLDEQLPDHQGGIDRRGFEWHYWRRMLVSGHTTLPVHTGGALKSPSLAFSPDGSRLASTGDDKTVKVWDTATGRAILTLKGHTGGIACVAFGAGGSRLATASEDRTVKLWDAATGRELHNFRGHEGLIGFVAFSPDGTRLISTSLDRTARVWDASTGREICKKPLESYASMAVSFSPDGARFALPGNDATVRVWDASTGRETLTLRGQWYVYGVSFSPDGRRIASTSPDGMVNVWDAGNGRAIFSFKVHSGRPGTLAFSPDGSRLACIISEPRKTGDVRNLVEVEKPGEVKVWDLAAGRELLTLKGHPSAVWSATFSPDGTRLVSLGRDGARIWDAASGQETFLLRYVEPVAVGIWTTSATFRPDGSWIAYACEDRTVRVVRIADAMRGQEALTLKGHTGPVSSMAFSADGRRLASSGGAIGKPGEVKVWDASTGRETLTLTGHSGTISSVVFSPDGKTLASGGSGFRKPGEVKVWDAATGREALTLPRYPGAVYCVAFSPDGSLLASTGGDGTVKLWDVATGRERRTLKGHTGAVISVVFSPDGSRLASASYKVFQIDSGEVKVWDAASGQEQLMLKGHTRSVARVTYSPDGLRIATASGDMTVKVWDAASGRETLTLRGHTGGVSSVVFSPDGSRIASAASALNKPGEVKVWDAATGQETLTLKEHTGGITSVAFSPDGQRLAAAGLDGTVKVWDARPLDAEPARPGPTSR